MTVIGGTFRVVGTSHDGEKVVVAYRSRHDDRYFGVRNERNEGYIIRGDFLAGERQHPIDCDLDDDCSCASLSTESKP